MYIDCNGFYEIFLAIAVAFIGACHMPFGFDPSHRFCSVMAVLFAVLAAIFAALCD